MPELSSFSMVRSFAVGWCRNPHRKSLERAANCASGQGEGGNA
jgi:hypothetical protein